ACMASHEDIEQISIAGPGFINFTLSKHYIQKQIKSMWGSSSCGVLSTEKPATVVVDYSAPNVAKEMHVGHLRSTIIGDAVARMYRFCGHEVVPQNHLGDWGTPFGMLIEHMLDEDWSGTRGDHSISDLNSFYQSAREKFDTDTAFAERARSRVVALQAGDAATLSRWRGLVEESERHYEDIYRKLGVLLEPAHLAPESFYQDQLADVVRELEERGLTV